MTVVACLHARTAAIDVATMMSTRSRTRSVAISVKCSVRLSPQRYSIATVWPSIQPSSLSRCTKASVLNFSATAVVAPKYPIVGSFGCCARAASGHTIATPPTSVMKSRRFITPPRSSKRSIVAATTGSPEGLHQADVRFGSKADVEARPSDVRFTPESGHSPTRSGCLLWAKTRHRPTVRVREGIGARVEF